MAGSYVRSVYHCIWSTKNRTNWITDDKQDRIWSYMGGVATQNDIKPFAIGGRPDHVHLLLAIPSEMTVPKAVQLIKGGTTKWIHETFPDLNTFQWQEGYGAFSVSRSMEDQVVHYVKNQEKHHQSTTFHEEFIAFLDRNDIEYDKEHVFG